MRLAFCVLLVALTTWGAEVPRCPTSSSIVVDKGVYTARPGVEFELENYSARMVPQGKRSPACFIKLNEVEHGRITVSDASLSKMFEQKLSNSKEITGLKVHAQNGHIVITGTAHKGLPIPFSVEGPVDSDGRDLRLHADKVKALGLPVKGLLRMLGVELGSLLNPAANKGVMVKNNAILFDPEVLGHVRGRISTVRVTGQELVVGFGKPKGVLAQNKAVKKGP